MKKTNRFVLQRFELQKKLINEMIKFQPALSWKDRNVFKRKNTFHTARLFILNLQTSKKTNIIFIFILKTQSFSS